MPLFLYSCKNNKFMKICLCFCIVFIFIFSLYVVSHQAKKVLKNYEDIYYNIIVPFGQNYPFLQANGTIVQLSEAWIFYIFLCKGQESRPKYSLFKLSICLHHRLNFFCLLLSYPIRNANLRRWCPPPSFSSSDPLSSSIWSSPH